MADEPDAEEDVYDVEETDDLGADEETEPTTPTPPPRPPKQPVYGTPTPMGYNQPPPGAYIQQPLPQGYGQQPQIYVQPTSYNTSTVVNSPKSRPRYVNKSVETEGIEDDDSSKGSMISAWNSMPRTSVDGSLVHLHPVRNGFLVKFYPIATLQGRVSYFLMSIYVINQAVYDSWFGGTVLYPYLFANMVYGYTFILCTRVHFLTMAVPPRLIWSFLGSLMFSFASCITFQWIADNWGGKSPYPRVLIATILSVLYGRMYAGALLSYLNYVDKKMLSLIRRIYGPYIFDI
ncbi:uncharacterized protein LOC123298417 [Chrysoperla carnea]|uniref:uncharacterized protein LOC123298417 n=1 Tax=Chrysoperla carnea TaxID=189513 RepID=UPI001D07B883|nr:uncharacterized protein LOC123298417 [Chrysoperla carnea]XP_044736348.1 uncharacterized protein LOC123298417 [Chrysoperla carnea]